MTKLIVTLLLGIVGGYGITLLVGQGRGSDELSTVGGEPALIERVEALEAALAAERSARLELSEALAALAPGTAVAAPPAAAGPVAADAFFESAGDAPGPARTAGRPGARRPALRERLVAGGFTEQRSAYIAGRLEELQLETMQARYEARRSGEPGRLPRGPDPDDVLREELGEAEYERYLTALGRPTDILIDDVIGNSPAQQAGLLQGDRIVGYDGARVFDMNDLQRLLLAGEVGDAVAVDVVRDGQTIRLYLPRGPLGIRGGYRRGR